MCDDIAHNLTSDRSNRATLFALSRRHPPFRNFKYRPNTPIGVYPLDPTRLNNQQSSLASLPYLHCITSHRHLRIEHGLYPNMTHVVPTSLPFLASIFLGLGYLTVINHWHNRFDSCIRPCIHVLWGLCNCILTSITSDVAIQVNTCSNPD